MGQRHKHADVIIAWAEGAEVEYRDSSTSLWTKARTPGWYEDYEYRVKSPAKKYRVAIFKDAGSGDTYTGTADTQNNADFCEKDHSFVRWLTDWVEYEEG